MKLSNAATAALAAGVAADRVVTSCKTFGGTVQPLTITGAGTNDGTFTPTNHPPTYKVCATITKAGPSPATPRSTNKPLYTGLPHNPDQSLNSYLTGSLGLPGRKTSASATSTDASATSKNPAGSRPTAPVPDGYDPNTAGAFKVDPKIMAGFAAAAGALAL